MLMAAIISTFLKVAFVLFLLPCEIAAGYSTVESLPGFASQLPFKLETGYIGVDESEDVQLFYYFVESESDPIKDPLVLWLTGGPGCSTISAIVFEIGPVRLDLDMVVHNGILPTLSPHPYSWTKVANIIFLDGPVNTGFSYSKSTRTSNSSDTTFTNQSCEFLRKWLITHPAFRSNPVYVAGDSYAGKIVPMVAQKLSNGIAMGHSLHINLQGYVIGNPMTGSLVDFNSRISFYHRLAAISDELYQSVKRSCKGDYINVEKTNFCCRRDLQAVSKCTEGLIGGHVLDKNCPHVYWLQAVSEKEKRRHLSENLTHSLVSISETLQVYCKDLIAAICNTWMRDSSVQKALHVREGTIGVWERCSSSLSYTSDVPSVIELHRDLNARGYRALVYSGDHDPMVPYLGTQKWIKSLNLSVVVEWRPWLVENQIAGYSTEYSNGLTFATVMGGGHTPPSDFPKECFTMFKRWISGSPL